MTDAKLPRPPAAAPRGLAPIINEEADRELGRIMLHYGRITLAVGVLTLMTPILMAMAGIKVHSALHTLISMLSALVIVMPFLFGMRKLFDARLRIGRELIQARKWRQAIAALDPFAAVTQRFTDRTGEAHYLLATAYDANGEREKALKARGFLLRHRPGEWADKLKPGEAPKISRQKRVQEKRPVSPQEKRPGMPNVKRRKRF
jgi:hypothetical protein